MMDIETIHKTITGVTGSLTAAAEVRSKLSADGLHSVPVVHIVLENIKGADARRIVFDAESNSYASAAKLADELVKGRCIRFDLAFKDATITLNSATAFQIL